MINPEIKDKITKLIKESTDDGIKGNAYREESYLQKICFDDVFDILLYYISLQADIDKISKIDTIDFCCLLEKEWFCWVKHNREFCYLNSAWSSGPGPMGGTAGTAEMYTSYHPGINGYDKLYHFFQYPKRFNRGWEIYRDRHIKNYVFPKWRRNIEKLDAVFSLAEIICEEIRIMAVR
jgi:hypothetical protein